MSRGRGLFSCWVGVIIFLVVVGVVERGEFGGVINSFYIL